LRFNADDTRLEEMLPDRWAAEGYHHHQSDAIFLAGIPDLQATLPHA